MTTANINIDRKSLETAAANTSNWPAGWYNAIFWDEDTGDVWTVPETENTYHIYTSSVSQVLNTARHVSAERIEAAIIEEVSRR